MIKINFFLFRWEVEENYCDRVKNTKQYAIESSPRLLDLVDAAVFDFLLDNGDRHHYEVPVNLNPASVFLFDNGKRFLFFNFLMHVKQFRRLVS